MSIEEFNDTSNQENSEGSLEGNQEETPEEIEIKEEIGKILSNEKWEEITKSIEKQPLSKIYEKFKELAHNPRVHVALNTALMTIALMGQAKAEAENMNFLPVDQSATEVELNPESWEGKKYQVMCDAIDQVVMLYPELAWLSDSIIKGKTTTTIKPGRDKMLGGYLIQSEEILIGDFDVSIEKNGNEIKQVTEGVGMPKVNLDYFINLETKEVEKIQVSFRDQGAGCFLVELDQDAEALSVEPVFYESAGATGSNGESNPTDSGGFKPLAPGSIGDF